MVEGSSIKVLLTKYYDGIAKGAGWSNLLADDFLLTGTVAKESRGRDPYVNNNFFKSVRGLRVREMITEGDSGFAIVSYDLITPRGKPFTSEVAEFWKAKDGRLDSVSIYFDTTAFSKSISQ